MIICLNPNRNLKKDPFAEGGILHSQEHLQQVYDQMFRLFIHSTLCLCPECRVRFCPHSRCTRRIYSCGLVFVITIQRVRCPECGKTHRVVTEEFTPYFRINRCEVHYILSEAAKYSDPYEALRTKKARQELELSSARRFLKQFLKHFPDLLSDKIHSFLDLFQLVNNPEKGIPFINTIVFCNLI